MQVKCECGNEYEILDNGDGVRDLCPDRDEDNEESK
jgi:hypothetical protein